MRWNSQQCHISYKVIVFIGCKNVSINFRIQYRLFVPWNIVTISEPGLPKTSYFYSILYKREDQGLEDCIRYQRNSNLTDSFVSLILPRNFGFFYILFRMFHGECQIIPLFYYYTRRTELIPTSRNIALIHSAL